MEKIRQNFVCLVIFLLPLFVWPKWGDSIREPKLALLLGAAVVILIFQIVGGKKSLKLWCSLPPSILLFFSYIVLHTAIFQTASIALFALLLLFGTLCVALEFSYFGDTKKISSCMKWLAILNIIYGGIQLLGFDPIFSNYEPSTAHIPVGFMGHRTLYGPLMVMLASYHLVHKSKNLASGCLLMALAAQSMMTIFSIIVGGLVFLFLHRKFLLAAALGCGSALTAMAGILFGNHFSLFSDKGRYLAWQLAIQDSFEAPWLGQGFQSFQKIFAVKYQLLLGHHWNQAHQELIQVFFELGIVGLGFVYWMLADFIVRVKKRSFSSGQEAWLLICVVGLANSMGNFPLHIAPLALFTLCGWVLVTRKPA